MIQHQPAKYRYIGNVQHLPQQQAQLGAVGSMDVTDWLLLGGGAVVAGVGLNSIYGAVTARKTNFIGITLGAVLTAVGVAVTGREVNRLAS